jgi:branched-chain amino acid transport system substrate-binding protein
MFERNLMVSVSEVRLTPGSARRHWRQFAASGAVAAAVIFAAAACGSSSGGSSSGSGANSGGAPYVIGFDEDLSGAYASFGLMFQKPVQAYVNGINAAGGINGHTLKLVSLDSASSDSQAAANAVQLMTSDHALGIISGVVSDQCDAEGSIAASDKVAIICANPDPNQMFPSQPYVFAQGDMEAIQPPGFVTASKDLLGSAALRVATWSSNLPGALGLQQAATTSVTAAGGQVPTEQVVTAADLIPDAATVANKIAAAHPNVVWADGLPQAYPIFVRTLRSDGYTGPVIINPTTASYQIMAQIKDPKVYALTGFNFVGPWSTGSAAQTYITQMSALGQKGPSADNGVATAQEAYAAAAELGAAIKTCGSACTPVKVAAALAHVSVSLPGLTAGSYGNTPSLHVPVSIYDLYAWDVQKGQPVLVDSNIKAGTGP